MIMLNMLALLLLALKLSMWHVLVLHLPFVKLHS